MQTRGKTAGEVNAGTMEELEIPEGDRVDQRGHFLRSANSILRMERDKIAEIIG